MTQFLLEQVGTKNEFQTELGATDKTESNGQAQTLTCTIYNAQTPTDTNGTMTRGKLPICETGSSDPQEGSERRPAAGLRRPCKQPRSGSSSRSG